MRAHMLYDGEGLALPVRGVPLYAPGPGDLCLSCRKEPCVVRVEVMVKARADGADADDLST